MLRDMTIVVTGSARGVGADIAAACAAAGARLVLGDILVEQGEATARALAGRGASVRFHPLDLGDPASIEAFARAIAAHLGRT